VDNVGKITTAVIDDGVAFVKTFWTRTAKEAVPDFIVRGSEEHEELLIQARMSKQVADSQNRVFNVQKFARKNNKKEVISTQDFLNTQQQAINASTLAVKQYSELVKETRIQDDGVRIDKKLNIPLVGFQSEIKEINELVEQVESFIPILNEISEGKEKTIKWLRGNKIKTNELLVHKTIINTTPFLIDNASKNYAQKFENIFAVASIYLMSLKKKLEEFEKSYCRVIFPQYLHETHKLNLDSYAASIRKSIRKEYFGIRKKYKHLKRELNLVKDSFETGLPEWFFKFLEWFDKIDLISGSLPVLGDLIDVPNSIAHMFVEAQRGNILGTSFYLGCAFLPFLNSGVSGLGEDWVSKLAKELKISDREFKELVERLSEEVIKNPDEWLKFMKGLDGEGFLKLNRLLERNPDETIERLAVILGSSNGEDLARFLNNCGLINSGLDDFLAILEVWQGLDEEGRKLFEEAVNYVAMTHPESYEGLLGGLLRKLDPDTLVRIKKYNIVLSKEVIEDKKVLKDSRVLKDYVLTVEKNFEQARAFAKKQGKELKIGRIRIMNKETSYMSADLKELGWNVDSGERALRHELGHKLDDVLFRVEFGGKEVGLMNLEKNGRV